MNKGNINLEYVDLTGDGGVLKKTELEGFGSICPHDSEVTVIYEGQIEDGRIVDNTRIRPEPYSFIIGKGTVVSGLEIAVKHMKIGEKARVKIRSDYAYGNKDLSLNIPAKKLSEMEESEAKKYSDIVYEIELVKHDKVRKSKTQMDFDERITEACELKEAGNELFRQKQFREAIIRFEDGLKYLTQIPTQSLTSKIIDIRLTLTLNITNCFIQLYEYHYALKRVNEALDIKTTPKCFYFRCVLLF